MQIMPEIWSELRHNILAGTAYLRELSDRTGAGGDARLFRPPCTDARGADNAVALASIIRSSTFPVPPVHPPVDRQLASVVVSDRSSNGRATVDWTGLARSWMALFVARSQSASRP